MRGLIGTLLAANLAVAVVALHPFGGSAEDLGRQQQALTARLAQSQSRLAASRKLAEKVQTARAAGDKFMEMYFMDAGKASAAIVDDLVKMASEAGIKMGQAAFSTDPIEGSDTLALESIQVGFEGAYANFTKFVNLLDKSPRFLIIENMTAAAPQAQGGQMLNVTLKIDVFIRDMAGAA
jgi:Tfp pilus assembly protein PilO